MIKCITSKKNFCPKRLMENEKIVLKSSGKKAILNCELYKLEKFIFQFANTQKIHCMDRKQFTQIFKLKQFSRKKAFE